MPKNYTHYGTGWKCLRIVTTLQTRDDSEVICEADGGQLAAIITTEESIYIQENVPTYGDSFYWIGLTDSDQEDELCWPEGTDVDYTYWYTDPDDQQPNWDSDCVTSRSTRDRPCEVEYKALCQWPAINMGRTEEMLDHENEQRVEGLSNKVSRLKNIAFDIQTETEDHNRYLDGMNTDFDSSEGLLSGSVHRITNMVKAGKGNRKMMCYMILGLVTFFFLVYYLISKVTAG